MSGSPSIGPYESFPLQSGASVPLYLITFDKNGQCQSPLTLAHLLEEANSGKYTDVHIFSHGWNNVFKDAVNLYRTFFSFYFQLRDQLQLNDPAKYRPLVVGVIWPSTWIVLPSESTPKIAAVPSATERDEALNADHETLQEVASEVERSDVQRLYQLVERGATLQADEARELAKILLPIYRSALLGNEVEVGSARLLNLHRMACWHCGERQRRAARLRTSGQDLRRKQKTLKFGRPADP